MRTCATQLATALGLLLATTPLSAQTAAVASAIEAAQATTTAKPCHLLMSTASYLYPGRTLLGHRAPPEGSVVWGIAMDKNLPIGSQSIEMQAYAPGKKLLIVPVAYNRGKDGSVVDFWQVYRVEKRAELLREYDKDNYDISGAPLVGTDIQRARRSKTRKMESDSALWGWNSNGLQTPYIETKWHRTDFGNVATDILNVTNGEGYYTDTYVYEACTPAAVVTPAEMQQTMVPALVQQGYSYCANGDPASTLNPPDCLGTYLLGADENDAAWQQFVNYRLFIPLVGTGFVLKDCIDTSEPGCWGEVTVSGITDLATILVPVSKAAAASKLARVNAIGKTLGKAGQGLLGLAALGNAGLGFKDWDDGRKGAALARFAGAGLLWFEWSHVKSNGRNVATLRQVDEVDVDGILRQLDDLTPTPNGETCALPDTPEPVPKTCDLNPEAAGSCLICPLVDDVAQLPAKFDMIDPAHIAIYHESLDVLGPIADKISSYPVQAIDDILGLGAADFTVPGVTQRKWGDLAISFRSGASRVEIPASEFQGWAATARTISGRRSGAAFEKALADTVADGMIPYMKKGQFELASDYGVATVTEVVVTKPKSLFSQARSYRIGTGKLPGENYAAQVVASAYLEEILHGAGIVRVKRYGYAIPSLAALGGPRYMPHTTGLLAFECYLKQVVPAGTNLAKQLLSEMCEADIAIFLRNHGVPIRGKWMTANYPIRKYVIDWYKSMGMDYY